MPSVRQVLGAVAVGFAAFASALPTVPRSLQVSKFISARQDAATGLPAGLGDGDILEFALTLELLEAAFYQDGFAKFPASDFLALGLTPLEVEDLIGVGKTESDHVSFLLSAISGAGLKPVSACKYKFGFTDAKSMVATAAVLENVGVSAYLGAAPLIKDAGILAAAGSILTVEARHQAFIRAASKVVAVPNAFDTPLGIRSVFTLAAGFIESCPQDSNLAITPFPALTVTQTDPNVKVAGSFVQVASERLGDAKFCGIVAGGVSGGAVFTEIKDGRCQIPHNLRGIVYVHISKTGPLNGVLTDDNIVAGPAVLQVS